MHWIWKLAIGAIGLRAVLPRGTAAAKSPAAGAPTAQMLAAIESAYQQHFGIAVTVRAAYVPQSHANVSEPSLSHGGLVVISWQGVTVSDGGTVRSWSEMASYLELGELPGGGKVWIYNEKLGY